MPERPRAPENQTSLPQLPYGIFQRSLEALILTEKLAEERKRREEIDSSLTKVAKNLQGEFKEALALKEDAGSFYRQVNGARDPIADGYLIGPNLVFHLRASNQPVTAIEISTSGPMSFLREGEAAVTGPSAIAPLRQALEEIRSH